MNNPRPSNPAIEVASRLLLHRADGDARIRRHLEVGEDNAGSRGCDAGTEVGIGYSYADVSTGKADRVAFGRRGQGMPALDVPAAHAAMLRQIRNLGRPGICVDGDRRGGQRALWDLKAKLLDCSSA
jgi:hypothetical protein